MIQNLNIRLKMQTNSILKLFSIRLHVHIDPRKFKNSNIEYIQK